MSEPRGDTSRSRDDRRRLAAEGSSSSRHGSRHGDRHDKDRRHDEQREKRFHSHREGQDRDREDRRSDRDRDSDSRRRERLGDKHRSDSSSKRHREGEDRGSKSRRSRTDDDDDRHRTSRGSSGRTDRHETSSRHRGHDSREPSSRDHRDSLARRSRSRSPIPHVRDHLRASRSPSAHSPAPQPLEDDIDEDAPNFAASGLLAAESNTVNGVVLKYHEPPEARKPKTTWRVYCFKDGKEQEVLHLGAQSAYLLGRDRTVVDIPLDHESCSKQHAVVQFRQTITTNEFGDKKKRIQPFLIDLESSNGSYVNENEIPTSRYYQLRTGDTLTFGASTREYVLLDESAA